MCSKSVSCYSTRVLHDYTTRCGLSSLDLLGRVDVLPHILLNDNEWIHLAEWVELVRYAAAELGLTMQELGCAVNATSDEAQVRLGLFKILPWSMISRLLTIYIQRNVNRNLVASVQYVAGISHMLELQIGVIDPADYGEELCAYNRGAVEGILQARGYTGVKSKHDPEECLRGGATSCLYHFTWDGIDPEAGRKARRRALAIRKAACTEDELPKEARNSIPVTADDVERLFRE